MNNIIDTLKGNKHDIPPIWLMRQAGRYLPEYMKIRKSMGSFLDLCYSPKQAAEVTIQPIDRFDFDAAIIFSDILVIADALGIKVGFETGHGPVLSDIPPKLKYDTEFLSPVYEAINITRSRLSKDKALIGFAGAPWTIATYIFEGGSSKDFKKVKTLAYNDDKQFCDTIEALTEAIAQHLVMQIEAGADVIQIFDSWAGVLKLDNFKKWVIEPTKEIISHVRQSYPDIPIIGFPRGAGVGYKLYCDSLDVDCVSLDQYVPLCWAKDNIDKVIQGNLDSLVLATSSKSELERNINVILDGLADKAFIFNLGHGITPDTPIESVNNLVRIVRNEQ